MITLFEKNENNALELTRHIGSVFKEESVGADFIIKIDGMGSSRHKAHSIERTSRGIIAVRFIRMENRSMRDRDLFVQFDAIKSELTLEQTHKLIESM